MKEKDLAVLDRIQQTIQRCTKKPEHYLSVQTNISPDLKRTTKDLYDLAFKKKSFTCAKSQALPELIVQDFDSEQIWQQLELENKEEFSQQGIEKLSRALASKRWDLPLRTSSLSADDENTSKALESESEAGENVDEVSDDASEKQVSRKRAKHKNKKKGSVLDDKFFKIEELNRFLKMEDQKESGQGIEVDSEDEELEAIDFFNDISDSEEQDDEMNVGGQSLKYADFFDNPSSDENEEEPSMENKMDSDHHEDEDDLGRCSDDGSTHTRDGHPLFEPSDSYDESSQHRVEQSSLEKRKERLEKRILQLEDQAVGDKPWQLKGEVSSKERPVNSLLEEFVEFDQVSRPAPIMTEQTTMKLEDIIRGRIKDKAWDDVEKKIKPVETPMEYKKKLVMNQEKSKESLAQIYENEYIKQREALANNDDKDEQQQEEPPEHNEIRELMHSLFVKLDALSNFHYTPKPAKPEIKIVSNVPAIHMEEVAPVATSDATLLAPEEIQSKQKGDLIGKSERTKTDMKRARRKKKLMQRERALNESRKSVESAKQKTRSVAKTRETKLKGRNIINMEDTSGGKAIKSSTAFFSQLQDQVSNSIKKKTNTRTKDKNAPSAVKLKL